MGKREVGIMPLFAWGLLFAAAASFGAGYKLCATIDEAQHARDVEALNKAITELQSKGNALSSSLEAELTMSHMAWMTINTDLEREIHANPVYNCAVPANGLRLINAAISGRPSRKPSH